MNKHPLHSIERSELRVLPVRPGRMTYQLHVGLPPSYAHGTGQTYPVVYVTDGYWSFPMIAKMRDLLFFDQTVPEFIVVGLGYAGDNLDFEKLRWNELSPVPFKDAPESTGRAAEFLHTIEREVIPFIEHEYRVDSSFRVLAGSSLGGLFTLFTMYTSPQLFHAYIAATPAVTEGDNWIFKLEEEFARNGRSIKGSLFLSVGGEEYAVQLGAVRRFHERIISRQYRALLCELRIIENMGHCGGIFEAYVRGLSYVFRPLTQVIKQATLN